MLHETYDIVIVGAGLVGTSLIVALQNTGLRIAVLETHLPTPITQQTPDSRPLALNYGSHVILKTLGIWNELAEIAAPIQTVQVSEQGHFGGLCFHATEEKVPALGYVVPFGELQTYLYQKAAAQAGVDIIAINQLQQISPYAEGRTITVQTIHGHKYLHCQLLIGADGSHSTTRQLLNIPIDTSECGDMALTVTLQLSQPHHAIARQRFTAQGTLAVLPLHDTHQCRLVWTLPEHWVSQVESWSDAQLETHLQTHFNERLGNFRVIARGKLYPLMQLSAQQQVLPGAVLLGNAAHTIYPVAAQGFNLGLRDVAALAEIVIDAHRQRRPLGSEEILSGYLRWRTHDQRWISGFTAGIAHCSDLHLPWLRSLRGVSLMALDLLPPLKRRLAQRLMGLAGRLPRLARGISE